MDTVIVLFNRDLRVHDHPALAAACADARRVVPLFVLDDAMPSGHRGGFLLECLADLRESLRARKGDLLIRRGDVVAETLKLAREVSADAVYASADVSALARRRERRLVQERIDLRLFQGVTVVPAGALRPSGGDHFRVFTPFWRAWSSCRHRDVLDAPVRVPTPTGLPAGELPAHRRRATMAGGETTARDKADRWLRLCLHDYGDGHDDLAGDRTSRLSPYLHFGCLSPLELVHRAGEGGEFVRQLCWRDFYAQVTYAFPRINRDDYRPGTREWHDDEHGLAAWKEGMTGIPIVDAGMRQLLAENWMHNRARLIVADYLVKHMGVHWRAGGDHFFDLLLDGDVANNYGNWQWVAGTGNDTRPYRTFNPIRQARRFDPEAEYVRRFVPELADLPPRYAHEPWQLPTPVAGYPAPLTGEPATGGRR